MATITLGTIISYWSNISTKINSVLDMITPKEANAFEQVTIPNTAGGTGLTALTYGSSTKAFITVEGNNIRFRIDGGTPTAMNGHLIVAGNSFELNSNNDIVSFKAISTTTENAVLDCTYSA